MNESPSLFPRRGMLRPWADMPVLLLLYRPVLVLSAFLFLIAPLARSGLLNASTLEELPLGHWAYPLIDQLQRRGHPGGLYFTDRPYTRGEVARYVMYLTEEEESGKLDPIEVGWLDRIREEFAGEITRLRKGPVRGGDDVCWHVRLRAKPRGDFREDKAELDPSYESIRFGGAVDPEAAAMGEAGGTLQYRDRFVIVDRFQADSDPVNEPSFPLRSRVDRAKYLRFPEAYLRGGVGPVSFLFGRSNLVWGGAPSDALTISGISPPFDLFEYKLDLSSFRASGFLAFLDRMAYDGDWIDRFLYGHRIDWRAKRWLQLGFSETAVVTGSGRGVDFAYLNPLITYQLIQHEEGSQQVDTDVYASIDWALYPLSGLFVRGGFLVDDVYLIQSETNRRFPNQVALDVGVDWSGYPLPAGSTFNVGYTRIGSFVYLHRGTATYYSHYDAPIGHPLGPDTDRWRFGLSFPATPGLDIGVEYLVRRRGENRLEPGVSAEGHRGDPFPLGVIERRRAVELRAGWFISSNIVLRGHFTYTRVSNLNNRPGDSDSIPELEMSLGYFMDLRGSL